VTTVIFRCPGKRGLGHLVRALNIAHALADHDAAIRSVIYTRGSAAVDLVGDSFPLVIEPDLETLSGWPGVVAQEHPDVVVDDTQLPDDVLPPGGEHAKRVYVMRRSREDRHASVVDTPAVRASDLLLIPHDAEEFGYELDDHMQARAVFTGPIIRRPPAEAVARVRDRYTAQFLLVSTAGGGGFAETADRLFALALAAETELRSRLPGLVHVVVRGPNYRGEIPAADGRVVVDFEPEMTALLAAADLVVAEGGYNTVNEIRLVGTPTAFVPGERRWDDQERRVAELAKAGCAAVVEDASGVVALAVDGERCAAMRRALLAARPTPGNELAAEAIIRCLATR
jgi:UDP:flavonoid glycosyltransferase YjiC (YdhE family)